MIWRAPTSTLFPYTTLFRSYRFRLPHPFDSVRAHAQSKRQDRGRAATDQCQTRSRGEAGIEFGGGPAGGDWKSTRLNSSHPVISYAGFCFEKKKKHLPIHEL